MLHDDGISPYEPLSPPWWKSISGLVMCDFLLIVGLSLLTNQTADLWGLLPFLLLLACPRLHLFHHHGLRKHPAGPLPGLDGSAVKVDG